jgi:hypothetical protein
VTNVTLRLGGTAIVDALELRVDAGSFVGLVGTHLGTVNELGLDGAAQVVAGVVAGFLIGLAASVMGVAGGELLIPTIVLLYGIDIKTAGSLSLMVSLPTMIAAFPAPRRALAWQRRQRMASRRPGQAHLTAARRYLAQYLWERITTVRCADDRWQSVTSMVGRGSDCM